MSHQTSPLQEALKHLPHSPEFRFLDKLISLVPGQEGMGEYQVQEEAPFLRGHFPGEPLFPGVLLLEAAAQLAGVVAQSGPQLPPLVGLKLTALRSVKILGSAKPGETIRLEAKILGRLGNLVHAQAQASVSGRVVLLAEITLGGRKLTEANEDNW